MVSTGSRIAQLRCERNWSQTNLAAKIGTNTKSVKDWEDDVSLPTAPNIKKLCAVLGTSADYLLEIEDHPVMTFYGLSPEEITRARSLMQVFIDTSPSSTDYKKN